VKRLFLAAILTTGGGVALHAGAIIDCSGDKTQVNSCMAGKLPSFTTQLDWATMNKPADGSIHDSIWTVSNGIDVSVQGVGLNPVNGNLEGLRYAYNFGSIWTGTQWKTDARGMAYSFAGHFDAPDSPPAGGGWETDPGDHLLGLALNGISDQRQLLLNLSSGVSGIGFRASSKFNPDFILRVQVFAGLGGTGGLLADSTFNYAGVGGQCNSLIATIHNPPVACNDAPFIAALGFQRQAQSVLISTNDKTGFYVGDMYVDTEVPEPGPMILSALGLAVLALGRRRRRRTA
jgi:hypothetical protein